MPNTTVEMIDLTIGEYTFTFQDSVARALCAALQTALAGKEASANKVTAWQASPDNYHYPSEKLVKDTIDAKLPIVPYAEIDNGSSSLDKTATVNGITELKDGLFVYLKNNGVVSASGCTLNINSLGAKPIYLSTTGALIGTQIAKKYTFLFVYNSSRVPGGCWDLLVGYDSNTTYSNASLGRGYGTCSTAADTVAKAVTLSSYSLVTGGAVAVRFEYDVPASATLNINNKGAKSILYRGSGITAGVIKSGDVATFIYDGTNYILLAIDRSSSEKTKLSEFTDDLGNSPTHTHSQYLTSHQDISGKADKVSNPTNGNFASLDANGNIQDSGHKHGDYLTSHQDISGKADKVSNPTSGNFASLDANGNIQDSGHKHGDYLTSHQDISGKADKVSNPTNGNFASLDANGNIRDSGHKHSDYLTSHQDISGKADKVIPDEDGNVAFLNSNGNLEDRGVNESDLFAALNNRHSHANKSVLDMVPSSLGTAGQALCINDNGNGLRFKTISGGGGLSNYDLTFSTLSNNTTSITFEANQQCYKRMTMTAGATLDFSVLNKGCNYLRIYNSSASDITIAIGTITYNNTAVTTKIVPDDAITVKAGKYVEIGIAADASEADITVSGTLKAL